MKYSTEELNEMFLKLPEQLQDSMASVDNARIIKDIGKKYGLHIDQTGKVSEETGLVLLGVTHPTEFVSSLTKRLGIDRVVASQVASDINEQIFLKVRELLKDIQRGKVKEEEDVELEPRPSKDALMAALEHPEGMLKRPAPLRPGTGQANIPLVEVRNPYSPTKPEMGKDIPVVAPVPASAYEEKGLDAQAPSLVQTATSGDILTQKMSGQFSMPKTESTISHSESAGAKKIDPYKEQV